MLVIRRLCFAIFVIFLFCGCDYGEKQKAEQLFKRAYESFADGKITLARLKLMESLELNPYSAHANFLLAQIYEIYYGKYAEAALYYQRSSEMCGDEENLKKLAENRHRILYNIATARVESPENAFNELAFAAKIGDRRIFALRLSAELQAKALNDFNVIKKTMDAFKRLMGAENIDIGQRHIDEQVSVLVLNKPRNATEKRQYHISFFLSDDRKNWMLGAIN